MNRPMIANGIQTTSARFFSTKLSSSSGCIMPMKLTLEPANNAIARTARAKGTLNGRR